MADQDVEMTDVDNSLQPVQILIDELKSEDVQVRLTSIRSLRTIASALGPDRSRNDLIPFLKESTDDEDDILVAMAEEVGNLTEYVGGVEHANVLVETLELLCSAEESKVREKSVESICNIVNTLSNDLISSYVFPVAKRLGSGEWFTSNTSACGVFPAIYPHLGDDAKSEIRAMVVNLAKNQAPIVRRAVSSNLGNLIRQVENEHIIKELLPVFGDLSKDDQDSVRFLTVDACVALGEKLSKEEAKSEVIPVIRNLLIDHSWRVRYQAADFFCELCKVMNEDMMKEMVNYFMGLLKDPEAEVRTAAAGKITSFGALVPDTVIINQILPIALELVNDPSQHVRASLASNIMGLAPVLGKDKTLEHLLAVFLRLLKDEVSDVRLNVISKLDAMNKVIGIELLSQSLLPAIVELAEDRQWRVRLAIINYIPLLAKQLGAEFFDDKLGNLCLSWLSDSVSSIRIAATVNLQRLIEVFGAEWASKHIIPRILNHYSNDNFMHRMTTLYSISALSGVVGTAAIETSLLPLVLRMTNDNVPNVRFNVCKTLSALIPYISETNREQRVKPALNQLHEDSDPDVKWYANQALQVLNSSA